jgi:molybdenum cofactor biosynthesis protein MoaC
MMGGMIDISSKTPVLRTARAQGKIILKRESLQAIRDHSVKKGDALETARVAAISAVKKTPEIIPHCHQIPIEDVQVSFSIGGDSVTVEVEVTATAKTGVEMESLVGALTALAVIWDMVKYLEKDQNGQYPHTRIEGLKVLWKHKGKLCAECRPEKATYEKHKEEAPKSARIAIITVSTTRTLKTDESGKIIAELAKRAGHSITTHTVVKDEKKQIDAAVKRALKTDSNAIIINGGTGISPTDITIEAVRPLFEKEIPGFASLFLNLSFAEIGSPCVTSRACAGIISGKVVFSIPGSPAACRLAMEKIILPELGHILHHATSPAVYRRGK